MKDSREVTIQAIRARINDEESKHGRSDTLDWKRIAAGRIYTSFVSDHLKYIEYLEGVLKEKSIDHLTLCQHIFSLMKDESNTKHIKFDSKEELEDYLNNLDNE